MQNITSDFVAKLGLAPTTVTDNTAQVSAIVDLAGYDGAALLITLGTLSDADATTTLLVEHGDVSNLSDAAAVPDAQLVGTEASGAPRFSDDLKVCKIGYFGNKRYLRATLTPSGNTGNIPVAMTWLLRNPRQAVNTTQIT